MAKLWTIANFRPYQSYMYVSDQEAAEEQGQGMTRTMVTTAAGAAAVLELAA